MIPPSFHAHKNGLDQIMSQDKAYVPLIWGAFDFDNNSGFNLKTGVWQPPAGLVFLYGGVWINAHAKAPSTIPGDGFENCAKFYKSTDGINWLMQVDFACPGWTPAGYPNTANSHICGLVMADGLTMYRLEMYSTCDGTNLCVVDGNPGHTYIGGVVLATP